MMNSNDNNDDTTKASFHRIDSIHPSDFYAGTETTGERLLLLITKERVGNTQQFRVLSVQSRQREDGRWALLFKLLDARFDKLFDILSGDLVESSRSITDTRSAGSFIWKRFSNWRKLLEKGDTDILDPSALRGLVGELLVLSECMAKGYSAEESITAWVGPAGADQDFRFPTQYLEVKTVQPGADRVSISSAEQLDTLDNLPIFLVIVVLDSGIPGSIDGVFTPLDLVDEISKKISHSALMADLFELKLAEVGFVPLDEYRQMGFLLRKMRFYAVDGNFPVIRRSLLPQGIGNVRWELLLNAISSFEVMSITAKGN